jgi:hypothetical protein
MKFARLSLFLRRLALAVLVLCAGAVALLYAFRRPVIAAAADSLLRRAGASDIRLIVAQASPWHVELADIGFRLGARPFAARQLTIARPHWWTPSLGAVHIGQARMVVAVPLGGASAPAVATPVQPEVPAVQLPAEEISLDGQLVVQASGLPEQTLTVKLDARRKGPERWEGRVEATAPGLQLTGTAGYAPAERALNFHVSDFALDLKPWAGFARSVIELPGGPWEFEGKLHGTAEGRMAGGAWQAAAKLQLRDGAVRRGGDGVAATGIEADVEFDHVERMHSLPAQSVRVRELRAGQLTVSDIRAELAVEGPELLSVTALSATTLGGRISAEPFRLMASAKTLEATLLADGIDVEQVLALTRDVPATATGRVDGRLPIRVDAGGLWLGTGWLQLKPGVNAEVRFNANGLLTQGMAPTSAGYPVMKQLETGLLRLRLRELRVDIYPPNAPAGRTAQLHLVGEPADPKVKAPVTLDLNVNGPLEKLLNVGLDSRLNLGQKR